MNKMGPSAWAMDTADAIVISEGLAPSAERELLEKIAAALDAERAAVEAWLYRQHYDDILKRRYHALRAAFEGQ